MAFFFFFFDFYEFSSPSFTIIVHVYLFFPSLGFDAFCRSSLTKVVEVEAKVSPLCSVAISWNLEWQI